MLLVVCGALGFVGACNVDKDPRALPMPSVGEASGSAERSGCLADVQRAADRVRRIPGYYSNRRDQADLYLWQAQQAAQLGDEAACRDHLRKLDLVLP